FAIQDEYAPKSHLLHIQTPTYSSINITANATDEYAMVGEYPIDVLVTDLMAWEFTITWRTEDNVSGYVIWGTDPNNLSNTAYDDRGSDYKGRTHRCRISVDRSRTYYYFAIVSNGTVYADGYSPWRVKTLPSLQQIPDVHTLIGRVTTKNGKPVVGALVYLKIKKSDVGFSYPLSAITNDTGYYMFSLSKARWSYNPANTLFSSGDEIYMGISSQFDGSKPLLDPLTLFYAGTVSDDTPQYMPTYTVDFPQVIHASINRCLNESLNVTLDILGADDVLRVNLTYNASGTIHNVSMIKEHEETKNNLSLQRWKYVGERLCSDTNTTVVCNFTVVLSNGTELFYNRTYKKNLKGVDYVELWYSYSYDNRSFSSYTLFGRDYEPSDDWSWNFTFPNGSGYYRFYSIAEDYENNREEKGGYDAWCRYCKEKRVYNVNLDTYYPTISSALVECRNGDRIWVYTGIYREDFEINKSMTIEGKGQVSIIVSSGIRVYAKNVSMQNLTVFGGDYGIYIENSGDNRIINCTIYSNALAGVYCKNSHNVVIEHCIVFGNKDGIYMLGCSDCTIMSNIIHSNTNYGLAIIDSTNFRVWSNELGINGRNLVVGGGAMANYDHEIAENNTVNGGAVLYKYDWAGTISGDYATAILAYCNITGASTLNISYGDGLTLVHCWRGDWGGEIGGNFVKNNIGIEVIGSSININNAYIYNNKEWGIKATDSSGLIDNAELHYCGISLLNSSYTIKSGVSVTDCKIGILIGGNDGGAIDSVHIERCGVGISVTSSSGLTIEDAYIANCSTGISLSSSSHIKVTGNVMSNCDMAIYVDSEYDNTISGNTADGYAIEYYYKLSNTSISAGDAAIVIVAECYNITISAIVHEGYFAIYECRAVVANITAYNSTVEVKHSFSLVLKNITLENSGIEILERSTNVQITNANIYGSEYGVYVGDGCANINMSGGYIHDCNYGLRVVGGGHNSIYKVGIYNNTYGVYFERSAYNLIKNCTINYNKYGVYYSGAYKNTIRYCNIYNNKYFGVNATYNEPITIDARYNWWGSSDGPGGAGPGSGDNVTEYVDYSNYLSNNVKYSSRVLLVLPKEIVGQEYELLTYQIKLYGIPVNKAKISIASPSWATYQNGKIVLLPKHNNIGDTTLSITLASDGVVMRKPIRVHISPARLCFILNVSLENNGHLEVLTDSGTVELGAQIRDCNNRAYFVSLGDNRYIVYVYSNITKIVCSGTYKVKVTLNLYGREANTWNIEGKSEHAEYVFDYSNGFVGSMKQARIESMKNEERYGHYVPPLTPALTIIIALLISYIIGAIITKKQAF
ncbi:MAG: hypothetical protein DRN20_03615, partial [Thermoplasmata archaeon]